MQLLLIDQDDANGPKICDLYNSRCDYTINSILLGIQ